MQSTLYNNAGLHVAIIMDGNGRWATRRGLPRSAGHRAGADAVRRTIEAAPDLGIATLSLFAFSADNWRRPPGEVDTLMWLLRAYLRAESRRLAERGARLTVFGRRDRIPARLRNEIRRVEQATARGNRLHIRVALDYSSRAAIARAAARWASSIPPSLERFGRLIGDGPADDADAPEVDLLIRTGGEKRLSDFMLWECAYAELWFTERMWPDFGADDLRAAVTDFRRRERRFGGLTIAEAITIPGASK
jgi:undecaprenyl diphosphate synthase